MTKPRKNGSSSAGIARSVPGGGACCEGVEMEEVREASHPRIAIGSLDKGGEDSLDEPGRGGEAWPQHLDERDREACENEEPMRRQAPHFPAEVEILKVLKRKVRQEVPRSSGRADAREAPSGGRPAAGWAGRPGRAEERPGPAVGSGSAQAAGVGRRSPVPPPFRGWSFGKRPCGDARKRVAAWACSLVDDVLVREALCLGVVRRAG